MISSRRGIPSSAEKRPAIIEMRWDGGVAAQR
jgi:hypothetical protein